MWISEWNKTGQEMLDVRTQILKTKHREETTSLGIQKANGVAE